MTRFRTAMVARGDGARFPWLSFLYLAAVFFVAQHDLSYSLKGTDDFGATVEEFTTLTLQGSVLRRVIFVSLGIFAAGSLGRYGWRGLKPQGATGRLCLFLLAWSILSLAWSADPDFTLRRVMLLVILSLGALAVAQRFTLQNLLLWVFLSTFCYLQAGVLAELALGTFHPLSGGYRFAGTVHPNSQGTNCAYLFFATLFLLKNGRRWRPFLLPVAVQALLFLFLTKSRTSLLLALITLLIYRLLILPLARKGAMVLGLLFLAGNLLLFADLVLPSLQRMLTLGRTNVDLATLTGRIPIWQQVAGYVAARPIQGYGYDSFWSYRHIDEIATYQSWTVTHGHSSYLDCMLGLGFIGAAALLLLLLAGIGRALRARRVLRNESYGFLAVLLIFAALNGLLESIFIQPSHAMFVCLLALAKLGFTGRSEAKEEVLSS